MTFRTYDLKVVVVIAAVIAQGNAVVYLRSCLDSTIAMTRLTQAAIALEYPLSDGHPSSATYALGHLLSSQLLRICRHLGVALWSALLDHQPFGSEEAKSRNILVRYAAYGRDLSGQILTQFYDCQFITYNLLLSGVAIPSAVPRQAALDSLSI